MNLQANQFARTVGWAFAATLSVVVSSRTITWAAESESVDVVVWIRKASDADMALSKEHSPALRSLARRGVVFPSLRKIDSQQFRASLQSFGNELGKAFREVDLSSFVDEGGLKRLKSKLGSAPPKSDEEKSALERLRAKIRAQAEAHKKRETNKPSDDAGAEEGKSALEKLKERSAKKKPEGPEKTESAQGTKTADSTKSDVKSPVKQDASKLIVEALRGKQTQLVAVFDPRDPAELQESLARDKELGVVSRAVFGMPDRTKKTAPNRVLIIILVPESGNAALVAIGHTTKRGRVFNNSLSTQDIDAGLRWLLGQRLPASHEGHPGWSSDIREAVSR